MHPDSMVPRGGQIGCDFSSSFFRLRGQAGINGDAGSLNPKTTARGIYMYLPYRQDTRN